jgi:hypothetical protein
MSDYDVDIYAWSQRQGALLRRLAAGDRVNDADLDWPNIAEEIETVGRSERSAVASRIATIIEHLFKLQASPAIDPRPGSQATIIRARGEVERLLRESPSIRPLIGDMIGQEQPASRRVAAVELSRYREEPRMSLDALTYTEDQVIGDWFPDEPR